MVFEKFWPFNYSKLLELVKINNKKDYLEKSHITNNIAEALHSKIIYFLPKSSNSPENFCVSLRKVFINDKIKSNELKRKDIKTRALISIIDSLNLNEKAQWIN